MIKIVLDGQELDIVNDVSGELKTVVEIRDSDDQENRVRAVSNSYTLTGAAYNIVAASFIDDPNGKNNELLVKIYDVGCCETDTLLFEGRLISDNVKWCYDECTCDVIFEEYTETTKAIDCVKSTLIYDNRNGFQSIQHPRMRYCIEPRPDVVFFFIMAVGEILNLLLIILTPIVAALSLLNGILQAIEDTINLIPGVNINITFDFDGNSSTNLLQEFQNWRNQLNERLVGCGRAHPSPLVRDYIQNVCGICGLQFQSSIYNDPASDYYNAVVMFAPVAKGSLNEGVFWIDANLLIKTLDQFLNDLKPVHNAKWEIQNGVLYFERKDFFDDGLPFVNYEALSTQERITEKLCIEWRNEDRPAYLQCQYQMDAIDSTANDALNDYNETVEWNNPYSSLQVGKRDVVLFFAPTKFRYDGTDEDAFDQFSGGFLGDVINANRRNIILQKHLTALPRLIIWDTNTPRHTARAKTYPLLSPPGWSPYPGSIRYNWPYQFNQFATAPNTAYPSNEPNTGLYTRFYAWENPKLFRDLGKSFSFSFKYSCGELNAALTAQYVQLPIGENTIGRISNISVNLESKTIIIQGNV